MTITTTATASCDACGAAEDAPPGVLPDGWLRVEGRTFKPPFGPAASTVRAVDLCPPCALLPMTPVAIGALLSAPAAWREAQAVPQQPAPPAWAQPAGATPAIWPSDPDYRSLYGRTEGALSGRQLDALNEASPSRYCAALCKPARGPVSECQCKACGGEQHGKARRPEPPRWSPGHP